MLLKVRNAGMQGQKFLRSSRFLAVLSTSLLPSGGPMGLLDEGTAASSEDHLNVLHAVEHRKRSNGCSTAPKLVGVDYVWFTTSLSRKVLAA